MAATGNEVVLLRQLRLATDYIKSAIDKKLDAPTLAGINGQMLVYGSSGNQWVDVPDNKYVLPQATSTTLGGVKTATDEDAKAFLGY